MSTEQLTAEQELRQIITGDPYREPNFLHEGPDVVRWLKGGTLPPAWVTFHPQDDNTIEIRCASCKNVLGSIPADFNPKVTADELGRIRLSGHENHMPEGWPAMNIANKIR